MSRYIVLNDRNAGDEKTDAQTRAVREHVGDGGSVVSSRDDFVERARGLGGFKGWIEDVATGENVDGEPRFAFAVRVVEEPGDYVLGKANADIVSKRLEAGRPVLVFTSGRGFEPVAELEQLPDDTRDYTMTAILVPAGPAEAGQSEETAG